MPGIDGKQTMGPVKMIPLPPTASAVGVVGGYKQSKSDELGMAGAGCVLGKD